MSTPKISKMQKRLKQSPEERAPLGKEIEPNFFWDNLNSLYSSINSNVDIMVKSVIIKLESITSDPEKCALILDEAKLTNYVTLINKDMSDYKDKLNAIYAQHKDKVGGTTDPDEMMFAFSLHGEYSDVTEIFDNNIMAYVNDLSNEIEDINIRYNSIHSKERVIDADYNMVGDK